MPYIVNNSDGSLTVTVADNTVDTATYSLALVGRNVSNYGQFFAQNTIRQLENFASTVAPSPSVRLVGQLWYDKREQLLRVWDGSAWRRATNIGVGPEGDRPETQLGGGEGFYNLTTNKLQIFNGSSWRDASYPGTVTTEFANNQTQNLSQFLGSRTRTLFLRDTSGLEHPVLAIIYVNSPDANSPTLPAGATETEGQRETIVALFSETAFTVAGSDRYYTELTASGGIADDRTGRALGEILRGMNIRADAEQSSISVADTIVVNSATVNGLLYADDIGSTSERIPASFLNAASINNLTVESTLTVEADISANNQILNIADIQASGNISANNTVTAPTGVFDELTVNNNTTLNGNTTINGVITVNGVDTQTLGNANNVIEDYFGDNITTNNLTVQAGAVFTDDNIAVQVPSGTISTKELEVTNDIQANTATFDGPVVFNNDIGFSGVDLDTTGNISANNFEITGGGTLTGGSSATFSGNINASTFNGNIVGNSASFESGTIAAGSGSFTGNVSASFFVGTATQAQYADLAEIYAADADYAPGTVVKIGGKAEITAAEHYADTEVFGVISTDPAYLMNSGAQGLPVALQGRVPVQVIGKVHKGQRLVSAMVAGAACALIDETAYDPRIIIGRALEDKHTEDTGVIEAVIGVK